MTERDAKLAKKHIAETGNTARETWKLMEVEAGERCNWGFDVPVLSLNIETEYFWRLLSHLECGGQGRNRSFRVGRRYVKY
jgi:hypothetical protein